ncbi:MAG: DsrE family protein [Methanimicrococcus sp.]|nr:DsrE family protein [Methanimicrococcus sp.]
MPKVTKVLILLNDMVYESTAPQHALRFARCYRKRGMETTIMIWGPMGAILTKKNKIGGSQKYDEKVQECLDLGVQIKCCELAAAIIGMTQEEMIPGTKIITTKELTNTLIEYTEEGQLIMYV